MWRSAKANGEAPITIKKTIAPKDHAIGLAAGDREGMMASDCDGITLPLFGTPAMWDLQLKTHEREGTRH